MIYFKAWASFSIISFLSSFISVILSNNLNFFNDDPYIIGGLLGLFLIPQNLFFLVNSEEGDFKTANKCYILISMLIIISSIICFFSLSVEDGAEAYYGFFGVSFMIVSLFNYFILRLLVIKKSFSYLFSLLGLMYISLYIYTSHVKYF